MHSKRKETVIGNVCERKNWVKKKKDDRREERRESVSICRKILS